MITSYSGIHKHLRDRHGPASGFVCKCGAPAQEWAYDGQDPSQRIDPRGLAYSIDCAHYFPVCRACHKIHDGHRREWCKSGLHRMEGHNVLIDQGKRRCRACANQNHRNTARRRIENRATDPKLQLAHERRMQKQRDRRRKAKEAS